MSDILNFAGFAYPRKIARLVSIAMTPRKPGDGLKDRPMRAKWCFAYHQSRPAMAGTGISGYLGEGSGAGWPFMRWQWCDEVEGVRIDHNGWFTDECQSQTIRGIILRLPHGRGFLAGQSMGEHMETDFESAVYDDEREAARAADRYAELTAEREREYQEGYQDGARAFEEREKGMRKAEESLCKARRMRDGARVALRRALAARSGEAMGFLPPDSADHARRLYVECLTRARDHLSECCEARREAWFEWTKAAPGKWQDSQWSNGFRDGACQ